ncbi:Glycosyl hydrolase [Parasponia andersonii]|uniref:galactinol--sucrose galactosyltransferase n=1 Tax=Parasponia andersonii TaxID=3476 RepID=A0A2P5DGD4_PARAD|nr:Glycosyl hydrolase [Parasponia andersonii]
MAYQLDFSGTKNDYCLINPGYWRSTKMPKHIDWFGWSTWDAFYIDVSAQGITEGLKSFSSGGYSPKFLIIDDGWQNTVIERQEDGEMPTNSAKFVARLVNCEENDKFKGFFSEICCSDLSLFIKHVKEKYGVRVVYAWHALIGYWGGVLPTSPVMGKYNPRIVYPIQSPGNLSNIVCGTIDPMEKEGIGFIEPSRIREFYEDLHGYLASCSVDGVKVDVQNILETLGSGYGGRVALIRQYQEALEESVIKNFRANNLICSMSMNTERIYSSKRGAAARVSEDFMPNEPTFQTLHVAAVAFNSLLLGEIVVPDWDMFYSNHYTADFHGAARALGGCAVYVSDKPGQHNFDIIKKLVLPDGSILRARYAGRPTRDCLFIDPVTDNKSLLKIWNMNKFSGIIGVFNCQRSGKWPPIAGAQWLASPESDTVVMSGYISSMDVDFLEEAADESSLLTMPKEASFEVSLGVLKFEIFTVSPIRVVGQSLKFAPIGLVDMYNSGAAVQYFECRDNLSNSVVKLQVRGCGRFGAYSNKKPRSCSVDLQEEIFTYNAKDGLLIFNLGGQCSKRDVEIMY